MKKSLIYMLVEGVSRGIPQAVLLYLAFTLTLSDFAVLTLLYGLESLLVIILPSNYVELLYKLQNSENKKDLAHTVLSANIVVVIALMTITLLFGNYFADFYNYDNLYVYPAIIVSALVNSYMRFSRTQLQLDFQHTDAIRIMLFSFGFANAGMIICLLAFDDKIMAFFIGKAIGFLVYFLFYLYKEKIRLTISIPLLLDYFDRMKYLLLFSTYSWFFGYGFSYITKLIGTESDVANIGYVITFSMPFLLLANGINQVYTPKARKLILEQFGQALIFSKKIMTLYVSIFVAVMVFIWLIGHFDYSLINKFNYLFAISTVVFVFSTYKYVYDVYIYVFDLFQQYILGTIIIETITIIFIVGINYSFSINIVYLYPLLILARSIYVLRLMVRIRSKQALAPYAET